MRIVLPSWFRLYFTFLFQGFEGGGVGFTCHGSEAITVHAVIIHRRLQEMRVLLQPGHSVSRTSFVWLEMCSSYSPLGQIHWHGKHGWGSFWSARNLWSLLSTYDPVAEGGVTWGAALPVDASSG